MEDKEEALDPVPCFLTACELERREHRSLHKEARVSNGKLERADRGRFVYGFTLDDPKPPCKVRSVVQLTVQGSRYQAVCEKISGTTISLSLSTTLGHQIGHARISNDEPDLLRAVIERLKDIKTGRGAPGWNGDLAGRMLRLDGRGLSLFQTAQEISSIDPLTDDQRAAIQTCLSRDITFVWGPPGTGKTRTLGALIAHYYRHNKRVLIVSNTNDAVDGVLLSTLKEVSQSRKGSLAEASVIRLGSCVQSGLREAFGDRIEIDRVVASSQEKVLDRLSSLKAELRLVEVACFELSKSIGARKAYSDLSRELQELRSRLGASGASGISEGIRGVFLSRPTASISDNTQSREELEEAVKVLEESLAELEAKLPSDEYETLMQKSIEESTRQVELSEAISVLEKFVRDLRREVLLRARVVACTAIQAILSMKTLQDFDLVVLDEASMVPLPFVYILAGMAQRQVVVTGDFRQLPAVSVSNAPLVSQWFSRDVFEFTGIVDLVDQGKEHPSLSILSTQFRSTKALCSLVNNRFYGGMLQSARQDHPEQKGQAFTTSFLDASPVATVDISAVAPWTGNQNGSKWNLTSALVVRKLALLLNTSHQLHDDRELGVITPYRPQAELITSLLEEYDVDQYATVGTVHSFQGAERSTIILDLTDAPPNKVGSFVGATSLREIGARLLNVALSRAKDRLIIVGNFGYLRSQLPRESVLLGILDDAERIGHSLSLDTLIAQPLYVNSSLEASSQPSFLAFQTFDENLFSPALITDLLDAEREIVLAGTSLCSRTAAVLSSLLEERVKKGIRVTLRMPVSKSRLPDVQCVLDKFRSAGIAVVFCEYPVYPMVILDSEVLWLGSLSPVDTISGRAGRMMRCVSVVAAQHALSYIEGDRGRLARLALAG